MRSALTPALSQGERGKGGLGEPAAAGFEGVGWEGDRGAGAGGELVPVEGGAFCPGGGDFGGGGGGVGFALFAAGVAGLGLAGGEVVEGVEEVGAGFDGHGGAVAHGFAAGLEGSGDVLDGGVGVAAEPGGEGLGSGAEGFGGGGGEGDDEGAGGGGGCLGFRGFFHDEVGVGAAGAEGADAGAAGGVFGAGPGGEGSLDGEGGSGEAEVGVEGFGVEAGGEHAGLELGDDFCDGGDAGGGFEVADVGFYGADGEGAGGAAGEGSGEAGDFDGVAEGGAGAVGLDVGDGVGGRVGGFEGGGDGGALGGGVGDGVAAGAAAVVEGAALDDGVDAVVVGQGLGEGFEEDCADAFAGDVAVAAFAEAAAAAVAGGETGFAEDPVFAGVEGEVGSAGEGDGAFARAQGGAGGVDGAEGGGAGGVDGHAGAVEVEEGGDAVGDAPVGGVGSGEVAGCGLFGAEELIVAGHDADEDAAAAGGVVAEEGFAGVPGVFQRGPTDFEEFAGLGVEHVGLHGGDAEEAGVEVGDAFDEAAPFAVAGFGAGAVGVVEAFEAPAVRGDFGDGVLAVAEVLPELLEGVGAGVEAGDADYGDVFGGGCGGLG